VWLGWTTMLFGMGMIVLGDISKNGTLRQQHVLPSEEE
jgi:hypothetical protein